MVNFAYAGIPAGTAPPDAGRWECLGMTWTGWDGSVWDLANRASGVYLLDGVRGLGMPTGTRFRDSSPGSHGSQHRGFRWDEREVFWPFKTWHESGRQFIERDRAFFKTLHPSKVGRWTVVQPGGASRYLDLRLEPSTADQGMELMPTLFGWAKYGAYLTADQPFWVGAPSFRSFRAPAAPEPFYEKTGPHLFNIGQAYTFENASIDNLGDEESFARWFAVGPIDAGAWVGVGDLVVNIPFPVPADKCLVIESDPTVIGATMYDLEDPVGKPYEYEIGVHLVNALDMSAELGEADFAPIETGKSVPLSVSFSGTGVIEAYLPNLYDRAW